LETQKLSGDFQNDLTAISRPPLSSLASIGLLNRPQGDNLALAALDQRAHATLM
jgi:hypothetical protein